MTARVAVIGTGLIGGSIGLALTRLGHEVVGYDRDAERVERAKAVGAVTEIAGSIADAARTPPSWSSRSRWARSSTPRSPRSTRAPQSSPMSGRSRDRSSPRSKPRGRRRGALRRRAPDGRFGAGGRRRRRRRFVRWCDVGAHADARDGRDGVHAVARAHPRPRCGSRDGHARAPRRARRARESRPAARGEHADGCRDGARGGTPHLATARGRRVPRYDAHRGRPPRDLARHPDDEPRCRSRRARCVSRGARAGARPRRAGRRRCRCSNSSNGRGPRAGASPSVHRWTCLWWSCAFPFPTVRA